jgi:protein-S-isoprenylcysteine O-methyltransferase Ste14
MGWVVLWGAVVPLMGFRRPLVLSVIGFLWFDMIVMPLLEPLVVLESSWLLGELVAVAVCLLPGLLLFRWTVGRTNLLGRAALQIVCSAGLFLWLVPSIAFQPNGGWGTVLDLPTWRLTLIAQLLFVCASLGVRAVIEFAYRGRGTPLPYDPPDRFVTSGPYAYVRNPMQLSMVVVFAAAAVALWDPWLLAATFIALVYGAGLAEWHEDLELSARYGEAWTSYRSAVRPWLPRARPRISTEATLLVAYSCQTCSSIGRWFRVRQPIGLTIAPAEDSSDVGVRRVTYLPAEGPPSLGVAAIARALEHIHLGWTIVGWVLASPGVVHLAQLLADVFGPTPHVVAGLPYDRAACDVHPSRAVMQR